MTTIAYRDGVLAADTQINYGSYNNGHVTKIRRVAIPQEQGKGKASVCRQAMIAVSGVMWVWQPLVEWLESGASQEDIPHVLLHAAQEFSVLMIDEDGAVWEFNSGYFIPCGVEYHSIGSGHQFAIGAMAHNASAPEAVAAAMKHDKSTGGEVHILTLADLAEVRKAA